MIRTTNHTRFVTDVSQPPQCHPEIRLDDFKTLRDWPGVTSCRLAVEAIVSCVLEAESLLYALAHEWLTGQRNNPLVLAIVLQKASYSSSSRQTVNNEIFDGHGFVLSVEVSELWRSMRDGRRPSWKEIVEVVGLERWDTFPPQHQPELWDACRRVRENPRPEDLPSLVADLVGHPKLGKMQQLRGQIVELVLHQPVQPIAEATAPYFSLLAEEMLAALINPDSYHFSSYPEPKDIRYCQGLFELARFFAEQISKLDAVRRDQLIGQLLERPDLPWVWSIIDRLAYSEELLTKLPTFLIQGLAGEGQFWKRYREMREHLVQYLTGRADNLQKLFDFLPATTILEFLKLAILEKGDIDLTQELKKWIEEKWIPTNLVLCWPTFVDLIRSGRAKLFFVQYCLGLNRTALSDDDLAVWLENHGGFSSLNKELESFIARYVVPRLPAGRLLPGCWEMLLKHGYRLERPDVDSEEKVTALVCCYNDHDLKRAAAVWENPQWRETLLRCGCAEQQIITSILAVYGKAGEDHELVWLETNLVPKLEEFPRLKEAFCAWAYRKEQGSRLVRQILTKSGRFQRWLSDEDRSRIRELIREDFILMFMWESEITNALFSLVEQRELFFEKMLSRKDQEYLQSLHPSPDKVKYLFTDPAAKTSLKKWLLKNRGLIYAKDWLKWIDFFGFWSDPSILKQVQKCLDHHNNETALLALEIKRKAQSEQLLLKC